MSSRKRCYPLKRTGAGDCYDLLEKDTTLSLENDPPSFSIPIGVPQGGERQLQGVDCKAAEGAGCTGESKEGF